jgi:hypothetical protein
VTGPHGPHGTLLVGVDGEMSGTDPAVHRLLQIGVAVRPEQSIALRIGWPEGCAYEEAALRAIGWPVTELARGESAAKVDRHLLAWADAEGLGEHSVIAVGWGVSTFDLPFITGSLPGFSGLLHHHCIELNAVCYALADMVVVAARRLSFEELRKAAKAAAQQRLSRSGIAPHWHDAGYDAQAALAAWEWLRDQLGTQCGIRASRLADTADTGFVGAQ